MTRDEIRKKMIWAGRVLVAEGQDDFTRRHISVRRPDDPSLFFMKPHSMGLGEISFSTANFGFAAGPAVYLFEYLRANGFCRSLAAGIAAASIVVTCGIFIKTMSILPPTAPLWTI